MFQNNEFFFQVQGVTNHYFSLGAGVEGGSLRAQDHLHHVVGVKGNDPGLLLGVFEVPNKHASLLGAREQIAVVRGDDEVLEINSLRSEDSVELFVVEFSVFPLQSLRQLLPNRL